MIHHEGTKGPEERVSYEIVGQRSKCIGSHHAQLLTYLRVRNLRLGLLLSFNVEVLRNGIRRILNG